MKISDPKNIALIIGLIISILISLLLVGFSILHTKEDYLSLILINIILFASIFLLVKFALEKFIHDKIKVIYKSIHQFKTPKEQKKPIEITSNTIDSVTQEVQAWSEEKQKEIEQLKRLETYRREFLGNVSHELKTPIFNIQGYVLTLLDGGLEDPSINREYLKRTEKSINRMVAIVEDLEEISMLEYGELKLKFTTFNIVELTREVIDFLEIKAQQKSHRIYFDKSYDKPIYVHADKKRIRQVLVNLIDNSIKYAKREYGKTKISFFDMDENLLLEVTDNGIGIARENIPRLFERFFRTDKARSREEGGTGLGLSIVKHIMEAHHQSVNVRSTPGIGSTFAITLSRS